MAVWYRPIYDSPVTTLPRGGFFLQQNEHKLSCPISQSPPQCAFHVPTNKTIDFKLIAGELIFGLGWGMAGLCPGPAIVRAASGCPAALTRWWPMFFLGALVAEKTKKPSARFQNPVMREETSDMKIGTVTKRESDSTITTEPRNWWMPSRYRD